jgi:hypothetical protein
MSIAIEVLFGVLIGLGLVVAPIALCWGWIRWIRQPKDRSVSSVLSLIGFVLATASGLLALSWMVYAYVIHGFEFYDPVFLRMARAGILLALGGTLFGIGGAWRAASLRWHAPLAAVGTLAFWILTAELQ